MRLAAAAGSKQAQSGLISAVYGRSLQSKFAGYSDLTDWTEFAMSALPAKSGSCS